MWTSDAICFVRVMFCRTWYNVSSLIPSHYPHTRIVIVSHTRRLTSSGIRSHTHTRIVSHSSRLDSRYRTLASPLRLEKHHTHRNTKSQMYSVTII